ncbi:MAG TPA: hypothetical protein VMU95_24620 [Trebonia sp.]|nr:hypothetical protein [Trebonia sp.]
MAAAGVALASTGFAKPAEASTPEPQGGWNWCSACSMLFYSVDSEPSYKLYCWSTGGPHVVGTTQYSLYSGGPSAISGDSYQANWNYCNACKVLYYGPNLAYSACAYNWFYNASLPHNAGTTSYDMFTAAPSGLTAQGGWNYCVNCRGLFHGSGHDAGVCVAEYAEGQAPHVPYNSSYWVA